MEFNKTVSNPMLVGCIRLLKEEDTPEHREMFVQELEKATFMTPALLSIEPIRAENGELYIVPGSRMQFPLLQAPDGKKFYMGFTDQIEYQKWEDKNQALPKFALTFDDYAGMLLRNGEDGVSMGLIVNSYGDNVVVPKEMFAGIMAKRRGMIPPAPKNIAD